MLMGVDQGAIVTLDGGETWSSWYNQSTDQIYHLAVDNSVPYWVYGTQQDAGAIRTRQPATKRFTCWPLSAPFAVLEALKW